MNRALLAGVLVLAAAVYVTWADHRRRVSSRQQAKAIETWETEGGKPGGASAVPTVD